MEGSLTGVSRLSNQLGSMFFISEDITHPSPFLEKGFTEICMQVRKQQSELDMEQQTGSK